MNKWPGGELNICGMRYGYTFPFSRLSAWWCRSSSSLTNCCFSFSVLKYTTNQAKEMRDCLYGLVHGYPKWDIVNWVLDGELVQRNAPAVSRQMLQMIRSSFKVRTFRGITKVKVSLDGERAPWIVKVRNGRIERNEEWLDREMTHCKAHDDAVMLLPSGWRWDESHDDMLHHTANLVINLTITLLFVTCSTWEWRSSTSDLRALFSFSIL